jgi:hypothetical protein
MGCIQSSKIRNDEKVVFEVVLDYDESLHLKGHFDNIHLFSEEVIDTDTILAVRGANDATKYFLVPKNLREGINLEGKVKCNRFDTKTKIVFVYMIDKLSL